MITTHSHFSKTIRSNSFAARLTTEQRDELFDLLSGGLSYREAGEKVRAWIKANDEAGLNGRHAGRELRLTDATTIRRWFKGTTVQRRFAVAQEAALASLAYCPETYKAQTWRALDQAPLSRHAREPQCHGHRQAGAQRNPPATTGLPAGKIRHGFHF